MSSPGASTPADASTLDTLTVTSLNVGLNLADSYKSHQASLRQQLAGHSMKWLEGPGAAAVALNEIHPEIAATLLRELRERARPNMDIQIATSLSNSLLWCVPQ